MTEAREEPAIEVRGLDKRYGRVEALRGLDLEVPRGSVFGFLGPNGAGKTTLMRVLMGLARPTGGAARVLGFDVGAESLEVRRRVGYLAQLPRFYDELTPRQTLRFARAFFPSPAEGRVDDDIEEAIELVGLVDKADDAVGTLSGGQRQRLGIAQACVHRPPLLILDEPAAALDPIGRRDVLAIMRRLRGETTIFYSTHILDDVQRVSDTVAVVHHGRCVAQAPIGALLGDGAKTTFVIEATGVGDESLRALAGQPWVTSVDAEGAAHARTLRVQVSDADMAEDRLLRLLLVEDAVRIRALRRQQFDLEDVFVDLVDGGGA